MPKRRTSYNLSQLTDYQVRELTERWDLTATEVVSLAVDRLYREQRWGLPDREMSCDTMIMTLLWDRLSAAGLPEQDRSLALRWCQVWIAEHVTPDVLTDWEEARAAASAAVEAWRIHQGKPVPTDPGDAPYPRYECVRCGHLWRAKLRELPKRCPKCVTPYWDTPRRRGVEKEQAGQ